MYERSMYMLLLSWTWYAWSNGAIERMESGEKAVYPKYPWVVD